MKWMIIFFLILIGKSSIAQSKNTFNSTDEVSEYMVEKYQNEDARTRAIYNWVISNFRYDAANTFAINAGADPTAKITVAFKNRKGVCDNISAIFNDICLKSGIKSVVISGYTKQSNIVDRSGHSWTAASVNNQWYLFDPTWDLGNVLSPVYFMSDPANFISTHMPFDPLWQLLNYPVSHSAFSVKESEIKKVPYFNIMDSIHGYFAMDSLQKLQSVAKRIELSGIYNDRIKVNYEVVRMNIEIAHQEDEVNLYNSAVDNLNEVTGKLNKFIEYRNDKFIPLKSDSDLKSLLNGLDEGLNSALKNLDKIDISAAKLVMDTENERNRIKRLSQKIADQKAFLKLYLNTAVEDRLKLFYGKK